MKKLLKHPHKNLRIKCKKVDKITSSVKKECKDLILSLKLIDHWYFPTSGIAANQIGLTKRIVVLKRLGNRFIAMINPEIISSFIPFFSIEICASLPGKFKIKKRKLIIKIKYQDLDGKIYYTFLFGLTAFTMQQEIDHLNGKLIID